MHRIGEGDDARLADFLTANDAWFMPVVQKTGPDGCLYILDWYDRYHCYQDANADPDGIERAKGRLYRVRYENTPHAEPFDLTARSDEELIALLSAPNIYYRETAQRLLHERQSAGAAEQLVELFNDGDASRSDRLQALWSLIGSDSLEGETLWAALEDSDPTIRSWAVRCLGDAGTDDVGLLEMLRALARDESREVQLQVVIAAGKIEELETLPVLADTLAHSDGDTVILQVAWENLHPLLRENSAEFLELVKEHELNSSPILPRVMETDSRYGGRRVTLMRAPAGLSRFRQCVFIIAKPRRSLRCCG